MKHNQSPSRHFSPYEKNQLYRFGLNELQAQQYGQMPVEYITGHVTFLGLDLFIDERALIPRVETEELVITAIHYLKNWSSKPENKAKTVHILDLGTGSGAIILSLAQQLDTLAIPHQLIGTDVNKEALDLARTNASRILKKRQRQHLRLIQSNLFDKITPRQPFELIIANLPYIPQMRLAALAPSVKDYEPRIALVGGDDGFRLINSLLIQAQQYLTNEAVIFLEIDYTHPPLLKQYFSSKYQIQTWTSTLSRATFAQLQLH